MITKTDIQRRINFSSWQQLEQHWVDGLSERVSLIRRVFSNSVFVHPEFLPLPQSEFISQRSLHTLTSNETLNLPAGIHDLILFSPFIQWTQDVPGMLKQAYMALAEDGFFVACFFGQDTLIEFKSICAELDLKHTQGLQHRFLPTIHAKDAGMLMQRARFASPTSDIEHLSFSVPSVENLVVKLRDSGVTNAKANLHQPYIPTTILPRTFLEEANSAYAAQYPHPAGGISVTVDLIFMCGWKQPALKAIANQ
jgi:hypothetical protein